MLTEDQCRKAADDLLIGGRTKTPISQLSATFPSITVDDAYAIQRQWVEIQVKEGRAVVGYKIGLTSRVMQLASKMAEPDYGHLLDAMIFGDGAHFAAELLMKPRIEAELAFVLGRDLSGPRTSVAEVLRATDFVTPALEIVGYRTELPRQITDTIADNAAAAAVVLGGRMVRPFDIDMRWIGASLSRNAVIEETGLSCAVMGHPAAAVAWLANKLASGGEGLNAGQIVLAGSFTQPLSVNPGDVFTANFGELGALAVSF